MKIKLDEKEIGQILINWAKDKYKTHNVSATYIVNEAKTTRNTVFVELEVTMDEQGFGTASTHLADAAIKEAITKFDGRTIEDHAPDFTPDWAGATEGLT